MDKRHGVRDIVEGERAPIIVQENTNAGRVGSFDVRLVFAVVGCVAGVRAEEAPGFAVVADSGRIPIACPLDAFVGDAQGSSLSAPLHLPVVGPTGQGLLAQNLREAVKSLGAVTVGLRVSLQSCFPVASRQVELFVCCVRV